ncbi:unnamed protein product [Phyllotreta striolata]|uniref:Uncharacterized protein n=1 Tax=Phyllotreta striolata TaxID=444603 RepID=A0A9N9XPD7_PHYSR|nr:unnamed protein product [Phyllotreta striolata]
MSMAVSALPMVTSAFKHLPDAAMFFKPQLLVVSLTFISTIEPSSLRMFERILDQCSNKDEMFKCFKIQAIKVVDRAVRIKNMNIFEGVSLVTKRREGRNVENGLNLNESKLENLNSDQLDDMLENTTDRFMKTHQLEIKVPKILSDQQEEARKKKGQGGGGNAALYWALAIKGTFLAIAYQGIAVMSGLAIIMGKMALLLTAILGLKKLVNGNKEQTTFEIIKQPKYSESHTHSTSFDEEEGYSHHRSDEPNGAQDSFESTGVRVALKIYDDCSKAEGFTSCLKKKAITFVDRLSRMDKFTVTEGVVIQKSAEAPKDGPAITEEQLDNTLPRSSDAKDAALSEMLANKISNFVGSRTIEVALPKISPSELIEEGRKGSGGGGGGGGGKKGGMKGMMNGMMMGIAAKMAALVPLAIAGLFLLAGKALITAKIALLISGIIAIKKLFAQKQAGGGGHGSSSGWQAGGGGGGGGWQSSGGGWDKRSYNEAQNLAYNAYSPK